MNKNGNNGRRPFSLERIINYFLMTLVLGVLGLDQNGQKLMHIGSDNAPTDNELNLIIENIKEKISEQKEKMKEQKEETKYLQLRIAEAEHKILSLELTTKKKNGAKRKTEQKTD